MRRSSVSIPSNIAEGSGKSSNKDFIRFPEMAQSSAFELETQLILAHDLRFISEEKLSDLQGKLEEIQKMIFGFEKKIKFQKIEHES